MGNWAGAPLSRLSGVISQQKSEFIMRRSRAARRPAAQEAADQEEDFVYEPRDFAKPRRI
jgi:hypothetical protein